MRTTLLSLILAIVSLSAFAQKTYLQVGKLVDTKNGKILTEKTIIVSGDEIEDVVDGY